jgi:peptidoglycan/LPS O-acetylase OafA/YrhL
MPARHTTAAFALTSYDLAEWLSLAPAERFASPALLTSLLLRLHLPLLAALWALLTKHLTRRWIIPLVLIVAFAALPPFEFVQTPDDANYRQQFFVALIVLACGFLRFLPHHYTKFVAQAICVIGLFTALWAAVGANSTFADYHLGVSYWPTAFTLACLYALIFAIILWEQKTRPQ